MTVLRAFSQPMQFFSKSGPDIPMHTMPEFAGLLCRVGPRGRSSRVHAPDYMLQGFVTKPPFSVRLDPFHWR